MTHIHKRLDLVHKIDELLENSNMAGLNQRQFVKQIALFVVDEMLDEYPSQCPPYSHEMERHLFWSRVKEEIQKQ
jgi:hypothetical protein